MKSTGKKQQTTQDRLNSILSPYRGRGDAVISVLQEIQGEFGWVFPEAIEQVADALKVFPSEVYGVATFYAQFHLKPMGRHTIQLCTNVVCSLFGSEYLLRILKTRYGLEVGGTSPDGRFSLVVMECIGSCDSAPAMLVNNDYHNNLNAENIVEILKRYE